MSRKNQNDIFQDVTLQSILEFLVAQYGWVELSERIRIKCFANDPSVQSSLTFLRRTPWARQKVEDLYAYTIISERKAKRKSEASSSHSHKTL